MVHYSNMFFHLNIYLEMSVSTLPICRLLINPYSSNKRLWRMVHTTCNISFIFCSPCKLYTLDLTHVTFAICVKDSDTKGVMKYFDFMRTRVLRIYNLEKLLAAKRIRLDEYAAAPNVSPKISTQMLITLIFIPSISQNLQRLLYSSEIFPYFCVYYWNLPTALWCMH